MSRLIASRCSTSSVTVPSGESSQICFGFSGRKVPRPLGHGLERVAPNQVALEVAGPSRQIKVPARRHAAFLPVEEVAPALLASSRRGAACRCRWGSGSWR